MDLSAFDFDLPERLIALRPAEPQDAARLLVVHGDGRLEDAGVRDLPRFLAAGDVMVFNDTRVLPAALKGVRPARDGVSRDVNTDVNLVERIEGARWLALVGLPDADRAARSYPHQLSGGMRQRAMIAIALACRPAVLIADEPTTALDVTIQAQILALMASLQRDLGTAILLITHDLAVIAETAHRVAVMYAGRIVEQGPVAEIFANPRHPYTQGLLASIPRIERVRSASLHEIPGGMPDISARRTGCSFQPRCRLAGPDCAVAPDLVAIGPDHSVACWRHDARVAIDA